MNSASIAEFAKSLALRYRHYAICAVSVFGALFAFSRFAGLLPTVSVAMIWAALTIVAAGGTAYTFMANKLKNRKTQRKTGFLYRLFKGGVIRFIAAFVVSAFLVACLMLSSARWNNVEWLIAAIGVFICPFIFNLAKVICHHEFEEVYETSMTLVLGNVLLALALSAITFAAAYFGVAPHYSGTLDAYLAQVKPFESSPSALLYDAGMAYALLDGLRSYVLSQVATASWDVYSVTALALMISSWFGFSLLLCTCMVPFARIRDVFMPLDRVEDVKAANRNRPRLLLIVISALLPVGLAYGFVNADSRYAEIQQTQEYTNAERFAREILGEAAYQYDGKFLDRNAADIVLADVAKQSQLLSNRVQTNLIPLVNDSYNQQISNIDNYLDWYYSLPADYERFFRAFTGTVESAVEDQLVASLSEGIDDSAFAQEYEACCEQAEAIKSEVGARLADCEMTGIPDYLIVSSPLNAISVEESTKSVQSLLDSNQRIGVSAVAGVVGGVAVKKAVSQIVNKEVVEKMATKLARSLGLRSASTAIGGVAGSVAPGVGNAVGAAAGTVIGVGVDFALLKADELQNRQAYHDEIAEGIEQARSDTLAALS